MLIKNKNTLKNSFKNLIILFSILITSGYYSLVIYMSIWNTLKFYFLFPIIWFGICYALYLIVKQGKMYKISINQYKTNNINSMKFFLTVLFIIAIGQIIFWRAFYPGGFNLDAYGQWDQVHGNIKLNDWHPIFTTAIYWLLTRIWDKFEFCIFVQIFLFTFLVAYLLLVMYKLKFNKKVLIFIALYVTINPAIGTNNICLIKDTMFTIALINMTILLINIITTKGQWVQSVLHSVCIIINMVIIMLIRHNGIFYVIPLLICMLFIYKKQLKTVSIIAILSISIVIIIQGPIFKIFNIEKHSNVVGEIVGIPMATMATVFVVDKENTPNEVQKFLLSIADENEWIDKYEIGEWDSCKWDFGGIDLFKNDKISKFIKLTYLCVINESELSYKSIRENTRVVWQVFGSVEWDTYIYIEKNIYGIVEKHNEFCHSIAEKIIGFSLKPWNNFLFWSIGISNLIFMGLFFIIVCKNQMEKTLYFLPILIYNLLTMLLLCGPSYRYFYFNSVLVIPISLLALQE